jgi:sulfur carrier protein ThiS
MNSGEDTKADMGSAKILSGRNEYEVTPGVTILQAMIEHGIDIQIVRPVRDGEFVGLAEKVQPGDHITLVPVIAGG